VRKTHSQAGPIQICGELERSYFTRRRSEHFLSTNSPASHCENQYRVVISSTKYLELCVGRAFVSGGKTSSRLHSLQGYITRTKVAHVPGRVAVGIEAEEKLLDHHLHFSLAATTNST
jgi:hypothetical protein